MLREDVIYTLGQQFSVGVDADGTNWISLNEFFSKLGLTQDDATLHVSSESFQMVIGSDFSVNLRKDYTDRDNLNSTVWMSESDAIDAYSVLSGDFLDTLYRND